jgi:hypothetical protein
MCIKIPLYVSGEMFTLICVRVFRFGNCHLGAKSNDLADKEDFLNWQLATGTWVPTTLFHLLTKYVELATGN